MARPHKSCHQQNATFDAALDGLHDLTSGVAAIDPRAFGLVKAAYSVRETLDLLSIGRTSLYAALKRGELKRIKLGKRTLFCAPDLAVFLIRLQGANFGRGTRSEP
jgi:hypothetical protein